MEYLKGCPALQTGVRMIFSSLVFVLSLYFDFMLNMIFGEKFPSQIHFKILPCEDIGATAGDAGGKQGDQRNP